MRARHWRERARELRAIATTLRTKAGQGELLALADELDRMAERIEKGQLEN